MIENRILRSIARSEKAYTYYMLNKRYNQALRIYKANIVIYELLQEYCLICPKEKIDLVFEYIFHLEDWFAQFNKLEKSNPDLNDSFTFDRLEYGISFPKDFKNQINKI